MKNSEVIKVTKGRQREALKIVKRIEARLMAFQTNEKKQLGPRRFHGRSLG
jgi:hypothetical protein